MVEELIVNVDWVAVIFGAIAAYALGIQWYSSKMFGKKWAKEVGLTKADRSPTAPTLVVQGVGTFLIAWVIGLAETNKAIFTAILIAVAIAVLIQANGLRKRENKYVIMIESGYALVMVAIMIIAHIIF